MMKLSWFCNLTYQIVSDFNMIIDMIQRGQRTYSYLVNKPQEQLGNMKKRAKAVPLGNSNVPVCSNTISFDVLNNPARQQFAMKIAEKYYCAKTIVPTQNKENRRPQSIKIVNREPNTGHSGISYLINKSGVRGLGHAERKHVIEAHYENKTPVGRKHYADLSGMSKTQQIQLPIQQNPATKIKVANDLMSCIPDNQYNRKQRPSASRQRQALNTMQKTSFEAGYEPQPKTNLSLQKKIEMAGNGLDKEPVSLKARRDDYRKSSIVFDHEAIDMFMKEALSQASIAVKQGEVPVGCVFVKVLPETGGFEMVKKAHNQTNQTKNAGQHAQMICLKQLERQGRLHETPHLYLFVTVEPCIMCAKALEIAGIRHVYFGQYNERFGGCGSVMRMNTYSTEGGYLQHQSNTLLKDFYEKGNQSLPAQKRNRKRVKQ